MLTHNLRVSDDRHFEKLFNHIENNKYILFNKKRQVGMSSMLLAYALANPDKRVLYFTPNLNVCDVLRNKLDYLPHPPGEKRNKTEIKNIKFVSANQIDASRGFRSDLVIFDEVAYFKNQYHHYYSVIPTISTGGKIVISTTPINDELDLFDYLYLNSLDEKNNFKIECFEKIK